MKGGLYFFQRNKRRLSQSNSGKVKQAIIMSTTSITKGGSSNNNYSKMSKRHSTATKELSFSSSRFTNFYQFICIVAVCVICYYNSTECGLAFDDISAVRDNKDLRSSTPLKNIFLNDFWGTPMRKEQSHKSYRPLTVLTYRLNYSLHELQPFGYHFINLLLHIIVCLLWRKVCRLILLQSAGPVSIKEKQQLNNCSFLAALLFAVHPIHTEAVTGIVGRAELLSSIFYLLAFLTYSKAVTKIKAIGKSPHQILQRGERELFNDTNWILLVFGFSSLLLISMLCKEQGITIAGVCFVYEIFILQKLKPLILWKYFLQFFEDRRSDTPVRKASTTKSNNKISFSSIFGKALLKRLCFLTAVTFGLLIVRVYVMGSQLPVFTRFDNPASVAETPIKQLTYSYLIYVNAFLLLFPHALCCDWTMGTIPLIKGLFDVRNLATLATFATFFGLIVRACTSHSRSHSKILLMCIAWMVLPFLPASNVFFPVGFVVAERILYMPSMGFCMLIAYGYYNLNKNYKSEFFKKSLNISLLILIASHALRTHQRNYDWKDDYSLFMSGVKVNPNNAKLFNNVGHALENERRFEEALKYFKYAAQIQEDDIGAYINVGRTYNNLNMYSEAEQAYLKAKSLFPKVKPGESYQTRIAPTHLNVFLNLANLIAKNHTRLEEADSLYRQAISMRADYVQAYINRGDILMKLNRTIEAQEVYEKALLYDSDNADIYYNLGVVFLEQGKVAQANVYFNKAIELYPEHEQALLNSAILLQEIGGDEARQLSRERLYKVLLKDENNEKVYFNLGMLAMDESNTEEAEQYFKRAIHIKSDFRSALFNLALLLAEANRPLEAIPFLNQLIRHHSDHIKGLILLGDIYINHMKDLEAAEDCYHKILKIDPKNIQGLHNLCVVYVERKQLAKASLCLKYVHHLAPSEDYIKRHLQIVRSRLQKILELPDDSEDRKVAFHDYNPNEFQIVSDKNINHSES